MKLKSVPPLVFLILACLAGVAMAETLHTTFFLPNHVVGMSALQMPDGTVNTRFWISHVSDRYAPDETCMAIILDTQSGAFTAAAVPAASCLGRQGGIR